MNLLVKERLLMFFLEKIKYFINPSPNLQKYICAYKGKG